MEGTGGTETLGGGDVGGCAFKEAMKVWLPAMLGVGGFECAGVDGPDVGADPDPGVGIGGGVEGKGPNVVGVGGRGAVGAEWMGTPR